ncbi:hypothetical protein [Aquimarina sp. AU474]|uniref:hypothetical protein n=1 Tax=Aquimarina sp. AU474 TaxID=2108529 RepID=UPI000D695FD4|nr:hypothetical protein [Aquimarina sp. AU474]
MEKHHELSDYEFETQFKKGSLSPSLFSHEAHLRLAWIYLKKYDQTKACDAISSQILNFATVNGDPDKFNKTVTVAAIKIVYNFLQKSKSSTFQDFIEEFPKLKFNFKELISCHYGFDIFSSTIGKQKFVEPDLLPF